MQMREWNRSSEHNYYKVLWTQKILLLIKIQKSCIFRDNPSYEKVVFAYDFLAPNEDRNPEARVSHMMSYALTLLHGEWAANEPNMLPFYFPFQKVQFDHHLA